MKNGALASLIIITILSPIALPILGAEAQSQSLEESISLFLFGDNLYWRITLSGDKATIPDLRKVESNQSTISSFNLLIANTKAWDPDFEVLSQNGFSLLDRRKLPREGLFLDVAAKSKQAADSFASKMDDVLHTAMIFTSEANGVFRYYSDAEFDFLVRTIIWRAVSDADPGFNTIVDRDNFFKMGMPSVLFTATKIGDSFRHTVTYGAFIKGAATDQNLSLGSFFRGVSSAKSSPQSVSSVVELRTYGKLLLDPFGEDVRTFPNNLTSIYKKTLRPGADFPVSVATLSQIPPTIIATREIDTASLSQGETAKVNITIRNIGDARSAPAQNITINEIWWTPFFRKITGNTSLAIPILDPGHVVHMNYTLSPISGDQRFIIQGKDDNIVPFSYTLGREKITKNVTINQSPLEVNRMSSSLRVTTTMLSSPVSSGGSFTINVTVSNNGKRSASNIKVFRDGNPINSTSSLGAGEKIVFGSVIYPTVFTSVSDSFIFQVEWTSDSGVHASSSNSLVLPLIPSRFNIPVVLLEKGIRFLNSPDSVLANVLLSVRIDHTTSLGSFLVTDILPNGFTFVGSNNSLVFRDGKVSSDRVAVNETTIVELSYLIRASKPVGNLIVPPAEMAYSWHGLAFGAFSNSEVHLRGIKVDKFVTRTEGFKTTSTSVTAKVRNDGPFTLYRVNLEAGTDSFLTITKGDRSTFKEIMRPGNSLEINYTGVFALPGVFKLTESSSRIDFAGGRRLVSSSIIDVKIFDNAKAILAANPKVATEGEEFAVTLKLVNPTNFVLQNVSTKTDLPSKIRLRSGTLDTDGLILGPNETKMFSATFIADGVRFISIKPPQISFHYGNESILGDSESLTLVVLDNITIRYGIPVILAVLAALATIFIIKRAIVTSTRTVPQPGE